MHKTELFSEVIGGGTLSPDEARSDLSIPPNLIAESELDRDVARLLVLHPEMQIKFRNNNLPSLDDSAKEVLLEAMRDVLGIAPLDYE